MQNIGGVEDYVSHLRLPNEGKAFLQKPFCADRASARSYERFWENEPNDLGMLTGGSFLFPVKDSCGTWEQELVNHHGNDQPQWLGSKWKLTRIFVADEAGTYFHFLTARVAASARIGLPPAT